MTIYKFFLFLYIFLNIAFLIIYFVAFLLYKKQISNQTKKQIVTYLMLPIIITFLAGFLFRSASSEFFTEMFVPGKWTYSEEYLDQNMDTGETWLARDKEYLPKEPDSKKYLFYFEIFAYLLWLVPGLLIFRADKLVGQKYS